MRFPKYLEAYPPVVIAEYLGVKPGTVSSYKSRGIPKKHVKAIRAIRKNISVPNATRIKSILKNTPVPTIINLVELSGLAVTKKTVEKWIKEKSIPLKYRLFLVDAAPDIRLTTKPIIGGRSITRKTFRKSNYFEVSWDIDTKLTDSSIVDIVSRVSQEKLPDEGRKQFRITGSALFKFDDETLAGYAMGKYIIEPGQSDTETSVTFYSKQFTNYLDTVSSLQSILSREKKKDMTITELTLIVSRLTKG